MKHFIEKNALQAPRKSHALLGLLLSAVLCVSVLTMERVGAVYILTGGSDSAIILDGNEQEAPDFSSQLVYLGTRANGFEITLRAGHPVSIRYNGAIITLQSQEETISQLLSRAHLEPAPLDTVLVDVSDGGTIRLTIAAELVYQEQAIEAVAYETRQVPSPDLPMGSEEVTQSGANGTRTAIYEVTYADGQLLSRQFVEELANSSVEEVVHVGTAVDSVSAGDRITDVTTDGDGGGMLTFASGATMRFSTAKQMTATAYTTGYDGVGTITATGTTVQVGSVAVDKRVIPLGSRLYVVTNDGSVVYGMAVAEDTGVRGNAIDLYHETYTQCINFGRRGATVYVLE